MLREGHLYTTTTSLRDVLRIFEQLVLRLPAKLGMCVSLDAKLAIVFNVK